MREDSYMADGRVTCFTGKVELGQGIITSLAQMLADEKVMGKEFLHRDALEKVTGSVQVP